MVARPGTIANVVHPGACVGGNTETHPRIWGIVMGALAKAVPRRVCADTGSTSCNFLFGGVHPETGRYYVHYHFDGVGWGGRDNADGNSHQVIPNGNTPTTPVEIFETRYPFLERSYRLRTDSGGAGRHRGGLGSERVLEVRAPEITVSALFDRMVKKPWGIFGGAGGETAQLLVKRAGSESFATFRDAFGVASNSRVANIALQRGDQVMLRTPGGGGYGVPHDRDPELVLRDVEEGFVSPRAARDDYGVAIESSDGVHRIDEDETKTLRDRFGGAGVKEEKRRQGDGEEPSDASDAQTPTAAFTHGQQAAPIAEGSWEALSGNWWDPSVANCQMCGQMIPRDVWVSADGLRFHSQECDSLYRTYWLPKYGEAAGKP